MTDAPSLFDDLTWAPPYTGPDPRIFLPGRVDLGQLAIAEAEYHRRIAAGAWFPSRTWHQAPTVGTLTADGHRAVMLDVDLRCIVGIEDLPHRRSERCQCLGDLLYRVVCDCGWQSEPRIGENVAAEAWLDHAWPGWADLEPIPSRLRKFEMTNADKAKLAAWLEEHQPPAFRLPGAPVRTHRTSIAQRHVPGGSPFGGYDVAVPPDETP